MSDCEYLDPDGTYSDFDEDDALGRDMLEKLRNAQKELDTMRAQKKLAATRKHMEVAAIMQHVEEQKQQLLTESKRSKPAAGQAPPTKKFRFDSPTNVRTTSQFADRTIGDMKVHFTRYNPSTEQPKNPKLDVPTGVVRYQEDEPSTSRAGNVIKRPLIEAAEAHDDADDEGCVPLVVSPRRRVTTAKKRSAGQSTKASNAAFSANEQESPTAKAKPKASKMKRKKPSDWRVLKGLPRWIPSSNDDSEWEGPPKISARRVPFSDAEIDAMYAASQPYKYELQMVFRNVPDEHREERQMQWLTETALAMNAVSNLEGERRRHRWKVYNKFKDLKSETKRKVENFKVRMRDHARKHGSSGAIGGPELNLSYQEEQCRIFFGPEWTGPIPGASEAHLGAGNKLPTLKEQQVLQMAGKRQAADAKARFLTDREKCKEEKARRKKMDETAGETVIDEPVSSVKPTSTPKGVKGKSPRKVKQATTVVTAIAESERVSDPDDDSHIDLVHLPSVPDVSYISIHSQEGDQVASNAGASVKTSISDRPSTNKSRELGLLEQILFQQKQLLEKSTKHEELLHKVVHLSVLTSDNVVAMGKNMTAISSLSQTNRASFDVSQRQGNEVLRLLKELTTQSGALDQHLNEVCTLVKDWVDQVGKQTQNTSIDVNSIVEKHDVAVKMLTNMQTSLGTIVEEINGMGGLLKTFKGDSAACHDETHNSQREMEDQLANNEKATTFLTRAIQVMIRAVTTYKKEVLKIVTEFQQFRRAFRFKYTDASGNPEVELSPTTAQEEPYSDVLQDAQNQEQFSEEETQSHGSTPHKVMQQESDKQKVAISQCFDDLSQDSEIFLNLDKQASQLPSLDITTSQHETPAMVDSLVPESQFFPTVCDSSTQKPLHDKIFDLLDAATKAGEQAALDITKEGVNLQSAIMDKECSARLSTKVKTEPDSGEENDVECAEDSEILPDTTPWKSPRKKKKPERYTPEKPK